MPMLIGSYPQFSHSHSLELGLAMRIAMLESRIEAQTDFA